MKNLALAPRALLFLVLVNLIPAMAAAQPVTGQIAAGADVGAFVPKDEELAAGWMADGFLEFYATPRVSIRPIFTAIRNGYDRPDDDDERQLRLGVDVIHNWEGGKLHPFLGAGVGVHFLKFYRDGNHEGPDDNNFGVNVLGGLEVFVTPSATLKFEARYQWVGDRPTIDPDGLGLLAGVKAYF